MARGAKPGERRGGRQKGSQNKATQDIKAIAQKYGAEAVDALASIMSGIDQPPAARVAAARELLDRGFGKAAQSVSISGGEKPIQVASMTRDEVREEISKAIQKF